ncbi:TOMM precursor leader peptide-binding protein [Lamprobacter modestohalophilus]|uniref:TOMM precursor leader peptide-binding protein n=1 Tax=Lamprobacter modestohalophilus TaxID=1064514 RepID=UPI002ADEBBCE|nr:TOMM precursor leader peptide-binding protein [Lamprobacter modestohalophilus]MEA1051742.1 TOMM precursor leader peptide-binding protein [Lamprobacter modestohalophilus]
MSAAKPSFTSKVNRPKLYDGVWFYRPGDADVDDVLVLLGKSAYLVSAVLYEELIPLLDGSMTTKQILASLAGRVPSREVINCLDQLAERRIIHEARENDSETANGKVLDGLIVRLYTLGGLSCDDMAYILQRQGARVIYTSAKADFTVVLTDHYLRKELHGFNQTAREPWIIIGPSGHDVWVGPLFIPETSACWDCLSHRLRLNRKAEQYVWRQTGASQIPPKLSEPAKSVFPIALEIALSQVTVWYQNPDDLSFRDELIVLDPFRLNVSRHIVRRRPQCPSCGSTTLLEPQPIRLDSSPKQYQLNTEPSPDDIHRAELHRNVDAETTLKRYAYHISPITGLVSALTRTSNAPGIHVFRGGRYSAQSANNWSELRNSLNHFGSGKGVTEAQAKASALAETLEWYSLGAAPNCKLVRESFSRLSALERTLPPASLVHFSANQLAVSNGLNPGGTPAANRVPLPFDPDVVIDWRPVWSLTNECWVYVPAAFCGGPSSCPYIPTDSNGVAAGTSLEDAIHHGFNELVERDALALWWYNRVARPAVALDALDERFLKAMTDYQDSLGREFWLLDITSDVNIPAFAGVSVEKTGTGAIGLGFGAHSDAYVAATRALTELNQLLPDDRQFVPRADRPGPGSERTPCVEEGYLRPNPNMTPLRLSQFPFENRRDIAEDVIAALERTSNLGLEMLVADLTQPDVEMPVVKVIVPGLRHAYPELAPGRLYDVPVKLGWRASPSTEAEVAKMPSPL